MYVRRLLQEQQMSGAQQLQSGAVLWAAAAPLMAVSLATDLLNNQKNYPFYIYLERESCFMGWYGGMMFFETVPHLEARSFPLPGVNACLVASLPVVLPSQFILGAAYELMVACSISECI